LSLNLPPGFDRAAPSELTRRARLFPAANYRTASWYFLKRGEGHFYAATGANWPAESRFPWFFRRFSDEKDSIILILRALEQ